MEDLTEERERQKEMQIDRQRERNKQTRKKDFLQGGSDRTAGLEWTSVSRLCPAFHPQKPEGVRLPGIIVYKGIYCAISGIQV